LLVTVVWVLVAGLLLLVVGVVVVGVGGLWGEAATAAAVELAWGLVAWVMAVAAWEAVLACSGAE
jgi:hypothetical protein